MDYRSPQDTTRLVVSMERERSGGDFTMSKKRWGDDDEDDLVHLLLPKADLIKILVWLPVVSLLRFKSVCKSWRSIIESSFFIDLHTATTFNSSSSKFGSFILHASIDKNSRTDAFLREHELLMLSESESESESASVSGGCRWWWWSTSFNEITRRAAEDDDHPDFDDQVFKVDDDDNTLVLKLDNLGFPPCYRFFSTGPSNTIIGSCNGLVCVYSSLANEVSLWNPATRQFRLLPKNTIPSEDSFGPICSLVSFGFDVETKDYKVLLLTCFRPRGYHLTPVGTLLFTECICGVEVYSLRTDSWRLLEGITSLPGYPCDAFPNEVLYLNGSCFFMANLFPTEQQPCFPENDRFIISFDFTKEIITSIQLPDHYHYQHLHLSYFGEKIALYTVDYHGKVDDDDNDDDDTGICGYEDFNIWVLNEHCSISSSSVNKESWTKLHSFRIEHQTPGEWNLPRGISNDGKFALIEAEYPCGLGKKMKLYNLVTKELKKDFLFCSMVMSKAIPYKPSLVEMAQQQQRIG